MGVKVMNHYLCMMIFFIVACGTLPSKEDQSSPQQNNAAPSEAVFRGYVNSAFELTVDGEKYNDMEDFYTKELARLPNKVLAAGYDSSWKPMFDARIGMNDLWQDMKVFISPVTKRGYQGEGTVGRAGSFSITLPPSALDSEYKVRAVKRITVVLTKENEKIRICYNFSGSEKSVSFSDREKPIVLDAFVSAITAYECQVAETGIKIPTKPGENPGNSTKLRKGATKDDTVSVLGIQNLFVASPARWCWTKADAKADVCANISYEKCQCSVEFDENGKVTSQQNIRGDLLDLSTW
jgi:hypothetical protein